MKDTTEAIIWLGFIYSISVASHILMNQLIIPLGFVIVYETNILYTTVN